ncbi:MAG: GspE/PulE family protein [Acidobacteriota bacterium]
MRSATAAVALLGLLALAAAIFALDRLQIVPWEYVLGILAAAAVCAAVIYGLVKALGVTLARAPARIPRERTFSVHSPERFKSVIDAYNSSSSTDVPEMVDYVVHQAAGLNASDIHLVPYRDFLSVRYRIDGILTDMAHVAPHLRESVTNRLKVLSEVVTYVHDKPQDGRFGVDVGGRRMDIRIAFMPTLHGERVVMRILDRAEVEFGLVNLGFTGTQLDIFGEIISRPQGMVILTGPTGSGKTTTIYCALRTILTRNQMACSIYTLEDPIEYDLLNINQTQIDEAQGFTFEQGLKTMLRQDPDVIMVGEIRDIETARIAIQAGMTGHLIITTVHAKGAAGVFMRLVEMGLDPHSVASAVTAVVSQRLVRVLCPHCKRVEPATPGQEAKLGRNLAGVEFYGPAGCPKCGMKGYLGRHGVFEILAVNEPVRKLIVERASSERIHREFLDHGVRTLLENGIDLARRGETSLDEIIRTLPLRSEFD